MSKLFLFGILLVLVGGNIAAFAELRVNYSHSAPVGIWQVDLLQKEIERGRFVEVCPPDVAIVRDFVAKKFLAAGRCKSGTIPFLKPIAAIAGDTIVVSRKNITVNGIALPNSEAKAAVITYPEGKYVVPDGFVWLVSSFNATSFDSRYFGPVPILNIVGNANPILTWEGWK